MRRRRLLPAVLLALLLAVAGALAHSSRRPTTISDATSATSSAPSPLDRRARLVVMDPMPLGEVLEQLSCQFQTPIDVDWDAFAAERITPRRDYPVLVELRLRDVTLRQVLAKVFDALDGGGNLAVEPAGDAARVVLKDPQWNPATPPPRPVACLYDVGDLVASDDLEERTGIFEDPPAPTPAPTSTAAAAASALWTCFQFGAPPETRDERLLHMVQDEVAPETWLDNGGTGVIWVAGGKMVVVHTPALQRQVAEYLARLREFLRAPYEKGVGHVSPGS
jgi:hypothetical protein